MDDIFFINFIYNFLANEMFSSLTLLVVFIFIMILGLLFVGRAPQIALGVYGVAVVSVFIRYKYIVPNWAYVLILAGLGFAWYQIIRRST